MRLTSLSIRNFRSLENIHLNDLALTNVLIGRNNAGKSSLFEAVKLLRRVGQREEIDWLRSTTCHEHARPISMTLRFKLGAHERKDLLLVCAPTGHNEGPRIQLLDTPFFEELQFSFISVPNTPGSLALRDTRTTSDDGKWVVIQRTPLDQSASATPSSNCVPFAWMFRENFALDSAGIASAFSNFSHTIHIPNDFIHSQISVKDPSTTWPIKLLSKYLQNAFFFDPIRHSAGRASVEEHTALFPDGSNLSRLLSTLYQNDVPAYQRIQLFFQEALGEELSLRTPLTGSGTDVRIDSTVGPAQVWLHEVGGGVEQLLMVAAALNTTPVDHALFLEEPESHLHPGAQRFLLDRLQASGRQVFITSHSPVFVNLSGDHSIYQFRQVNAVTEITRVGDAPIRDLLSEIGVHNSDLFLSDAVLFLEGPSEESVFSIWCDSFGINFEKLNITTIITSGGYSSHAKLRSKLIEDISDGSPIPHLIILDRDERDSGEILELKTNLGNRVYVLERREIENYFLCPQIIRSALLKKHLQQANICELLRATSDDQIAALVQAAADDLYGLVLIKRVRAKLGGAAGGLLPRDAVNDLVQHAKTEYLVNEIVSAMSAVAASLIDLANIKLLVDEERAALDLEWAEPAERLRLAPGADVLEVVCRHFGSSYRKTTDAPAFALSMKATDFPTEICELIERIAGLSIRHRRAGH